MYTINIKRIAYLSVLLVVLVLGMSYAITVSAGEGMFVITHSGPSACGGGGGEDLANCNADTEGHWVCISQGEQECNAGSVFGIIDHAQGQYCGGCPIGGGGGVE